MAHAALHFSLGSLVAAAAFVPRVIRALRAGEGTARPVRDWIVASCGFGMLAVVPSLARRMSGASWADGPWADAFFLSYHLDGLVSGGAVLGPLTLGLCLAAQYTAIVALLARQRRRAGGMSCSMDGGRPGSAEGPTE